MASGHGRRLLISADADTRPRGGLTVMAELDPGTDEPEDIAEIDALAARLAGAGDEDERLALRSEWRERHDDELDESGFVAPAIAVDILCRHLHRPAAAPSACVYDAGCGDGRVGALLCRRGFDDIVGGATSTEAERRAVARGVYRAVHRADYAEPLTLDSASFVGAIAVGLYSEGCRARFLDEMLRILVPRGVLVFTARPVYWDREVEDDIESLVQKRLADVLSIDRKPYLVAQRATAWYACLRKRGKR